MNTRIVSALAAAAAITLATPGLVARIQAQQHSGLQRPEDELKSWRSLEQPMPSARAVKLPDGNPLTMLPVLGNVYLLAGGPSNVVVQTGSDGVLVIDTATAQLSDAILQGIRAVSEGPINYIFNTTSDAEHYGGNEKLAASGINPTVAEPFLTGPGNRQADLTAGVNNGPQRQQGAIIMSHENVLNRMSAPTGATPAEPFAMWPSNTFFTMRKTLWFNEEPIEMHHMPAAHTDADMIVFMRGSDVVAAGDIIDTLGYPRIDLKKGGSMQGILDGLNHIIDLTVPRFNQQGGTRVVPGHGRILNEADVVEYRDMMTIIRDRVKLGVDKNMTLAQVKAMGPTLEYDPLYSRQGWTGETVIELVYNELRAAEAKTAKPAARPAAGAR